MNKSNSTQYVEVLVTDDTGVVDCIIIPVVPAGGDDSLAEVVDNFTLMSSDENTLYTSYCWERAFYGHQ